jgi:hypothetical protein
MDQRERPDMIEPTLAAEPIEKAEATETTEPTDRIEPDEPSERDKPLVRDEPPPVRMRSLSQPGPVLGRTARGQGAGSRSGRRHCPATGPASSAAQLR